MQPGPSGHGLLVSLASATAFCGLLSVSHLATSCSQNSPLDASGFGRMLTFAAPTSSSFALNGSVGLCGTDAVRCGALTVCGFAATSTPTGARPGLAHAVATMNSPVNPASAMLRARARAEPSFSLICMRVSLEMPGRVAGTGLVDFGGHP